MPIFLIRASFKFFSFVLAASVAVVGVYLFLEIRKPKSFPHLEAGAFAGSISGLSDVSKETVSLYVEKISRRNALLFVPFIDSTKPLVLPLRRQKGVDAQDSSYEPIEIPLGDKTFMLAGKGSEGSYRGVVLLGGKKTGSWSLESISVEELRGGAKNLPKGFSSERWLASKAQHRNALDERNQFLDEIALKKRRLEKLQAITADANLFRQRSADHKQKLEADITALNSQLSSEQEKVRRLVRELEQLDRITRRGRAIELARRVAKRENKWYLVNWQQGAELGSMEDALAQKMNIDLVKLGEQYRRATETRALKNTIAKEKSRVAELEKLYYLKVRESRRPEIQQPKEEKSWWNIFG